LISVSRQIEQLEQERLALEKFVQPFNQFDNALLDERELLKLALKERDNDTVNAVCQDLKRLEQQLSRLELAHIFSGEMDAHNAFLDIQAGADDAEAEDWAHMLLRMYLRWAERRGFNMEIMDHSVGEIAGIKSAAVHVKGENAYGWLRTENGRHRLRRQSPFDLNKRRYTSFATVSVVPEVNDVEINPDDLRIDIYRATGAGGPHVCRAFSAVRITHLPTNIVVQCQNDRSSHKNKAKVIMHLKAKLYDLKMSQPNANQQTTPTSQSDEMSKGHHIRSYVLDKPFIKDTRTGLKTENVQAVLDGEIDDFIIASLKSGLYMKRTSNPCSL
jgi:peptide chain release factor 2